MVKFKDFSQPLSVFQVLFKTVLYIQVLFKPVRTLVTGSTWNNAESALFVSLDTNKIAPFIDRIDALNTEQVSAKAIEDLTSECS